MNNTGKPIYNLSQGHALVHYAKRHGITQFTLHAYTAGRSPLKDEHGYTRANNADVAVLQIHPDNLGVGIVTLLKDNPGTDVTISSRVQMGDEMFHIPMLDMKIPYVPRMYQPEVNRVALDMNKYLESIRFGSVGPPTVYVSGNSFHLYFLNSTPVVENRFHTLAGAALVVDRENYVDHAWIGFGLERGEFRLRLTAQQSKYKMLPTTAWDLNLQACKYEEIPF